MKNVPIYSPPQGGNFGAPGSTVDATVVPIKNVGDAFYIIYKDAGDSLYKARNTVTGAIDSSNSDAAVVIQYAVDHLSTNRTISVRGGTSLLGSNLNLVDKSFRMIGERGSASGNAGQSGDTILKANYTGSAGTALLNCHNTGYCKQQFENLIVDANGTVPIVLDAFDVRERAPFLRSVQLFNGTDTGLLLGKAVYATIEDTVIAANTNYGIHVPTATTNVINTFYVFGGRITSNGINVYIENGNDFAFQDTILEAPTTTSVKHAAGVNFGRYRDCSFEWHPAVNTNPAIDESGNNITYDNCRFDSNNTTYYAIIFRAAAKNIKFINNNFQANNTSTTAYLQAESGATGVIANNTQNTNTVLTVIFRDGTLGVGFAQYGNTFDVDNVAWQGAYQKSGYFVVGANKSGIGLLSGLTATGEGFASFSASDPCRGLRYTTAASAGSTMGLKNQSFTMIRKWYPKLFVKFRLNDSTTGNTRFFLGYTSNGSDIPNNDELLPSLSGIGLGKNSTTGNWSIIHNSGSASSTVDTYGSGIAVDANIHTLKIIADEAGTRFIIQLDDQLPQIVTAAIPAQSSQMSLVEQVQAVTTTAVTFDIFNQHMTSI